MIRNIKAAALLLAAMSLSGTAIAERNFALTGGLGTAGGTAEAQIRLNDWVQLRAGGNYLAFDEDVDVDDITYEGELDLSGLGAFVDVHPLGGSFFVSGGAMSGSKSIDLTASSTLPIEIGGVTFTPEQYGQLEGDVSFDDVAPFAGVGFDTTFQGDGHWGFSLMAGAALFGSGDVSLESVGGTLSGQPALEAELEAEEQKIEDEIEDYELYPVLQVGLSYRF